MNEKTKFKKGDKVKLINTEYKSFYIESKIGDIGIVRYAENDRVYLSSINDRYCDKKWKLEDIVLVTEVKPIYKAKSTEFSQNKKQFKLLNYEQY